MPLLPSFAGGSKLPSNENSSSQAYHKCLVMTGSKKIAEPLESIRFGDFSLFCRCGFCCIRCRTSGIHNALQYAVIYRGELIHLAELHLHVVHCGEQQILGRLISECNGIACITGGIRVVCDLVVLHAPCGCGALYCRIRSCCRTVRLPSKMLQCHIFFVSYAIPLFCCSPVKIKRVNKKFKKFLPTRFFLFSTLERATRIELATSAWEADVLPLNYARRRRPQTVKNLELET